MSRPVGLLIVALLLSAVLALSLPGQLHWHHVVQDAAHGLVFAGIALVLLLMRRAGPGAPARADFAWAGATAVVLGIATELLQRFQPGRTVSILDVVNDAAGSALGLAVLALDLTNPGEHPLQLMLKVQDAGHNLEHDDRLNLPIVIAPSTRTTVQVALAAITTAPATRPMDLARMANVALFTTGTPLDGEFHVSRTRLE